MGHHRYMDEWRSDTAAHGLQDEYAPCDTLLDPDTYGTADYPTGETTVDPFCLRCGVTLNPAGLCFTCTCFGCGAPLNGELMCGGCGLPNRTGDHAWDRWYWESRQPRREAA